MKLLRNCFTKRNRRQDCFQSLFFMFYKETYIKNRVVLQILRMLQDKLVNISDHDYICNDTGINFS